MTLLDIAFVAWAILSAIALVGLWLYFKRAPIREIDAAIRRRSLPAWVAFRATAGLFAAVGLYLWVGIWFGRNFWAGLSMAFMCALVLAQELGILPGSRRLHHGGTDGDSQP